jgi:hypothetical protein
MGWYWNCINHEPNPSSWSSVIIWFAIKKTSLSRSCASWMIEISSSSEKLCVNRVPYVSCPTMIPSTCSKTISRLIISCNVISFFIHLSFWIMRYHHLHHKTACQIEDDGLKRIWITQVFWVNPVCVCWPLQDWGGGNGGYHTPQIHLFLSKPYIF